MLSSRGRRRNSRRGCQVLIIPFWFHTNGAIASAPFLPPRRLGTAEWKGCSETDQHRGCVGFWNVRFWEQQMFFCKACTAERSWQRPTKSVLFLIHPLAWPLENSSCSGELFLKTYTHYQTPTTFICFLTRICLEIQPYSRMIYLYCFNYCTKICFQFHFDLPSTTNNLNNAKY